MPSTMYGIRSDTLHNVRRSLMTLTSKMISNLNDAVRPLHFLRRGPPNVHRQRPALMAVDPGHLPRKPAALDLEQGRPADHRSVPIPLLSKHLHLTMPPNSAPRPLQLECTRPISPPTRRLTPFRHPHRDFLHTFHRHPIPPPLLDG
jgi:hypothetical protein